ncbi:DUF255 domain-containing protein, partial [Bacillus velezensis]
KRENKPVLISIGYSTCHWCHNLFSKQEISTKGNKSYIFR